MAKYDDRQPYHLTKSQLEGEVEDLRADFAAMTAYVRDVEGELREYMAYDHADGIAIAESIDDIRAKHPRASALLAEEGE